MTMKVTTNNTAGTKDPSADAKGTVDNNGKVTVMPKETKEPSQRPAWLPEGFESPEQFREEYDKLKAPKLAEDNKITQQKVESQKLDLPALEKEWFENGGKLTEKTLKDLESKGLGGDAVNSYVASRQKEVQAYEAELATHVGGADNMKTLMMWAAQNLDQPTIERYNATLKNTKDPAAAKDVMDLILGKYEAINGASGRSSTGAGVPVGAPGGVEPIADMKELVSLQQDPKYKSGNRAFHAMVKARIKASPHLYGRG